MAVFRSAVTLALAIMCAPALIMAAPAAPSAQAPAGDGSAQKPSGPPKAPDMLMMADVLVRSGRVAEARIVLAQVIVHFPDSVWAKWGNLGLGFLDLARGRMDDAYPRYQAAATGLPNDTTTVVLALLDAQAGNTASAAATLDLMAVDASLRPAVRDAAAVGAGYVRYWAGDYAGAAVAFAVLPDNNPGSPLADDALYGLAQSFQQLGDPESAEQVLERINEMPAQGFDDTHVRPALRRLEFREILRATRKRYDDVQLGQPDQMLTALLDVNGRVLAKGTLKALAKKRKRAAEGSAIAAAARNANAALARRSMTHISTDAPMGPAPSGARKSDATVTPPAAPPADGSRHHAPPAEPGGAAAGLLVLLLVVVALAVVIRRRWGLPVFFRFRRAASRPAGR